LALKRNYEQGLVPHDLRFSQYALRVASQVSRFTPHVSRLAPDIDPFSPCRQSLDRSSPSRQAIAFGETFGAG